MKILFISYHYSLSDSTGSLRPRAMAKYLPQNGIEVVVLTYLPQREAVSFVGNMIGVKDVTRETVPLLVYYAWRIWQKGLRSLGLYRGGLEYWRNVAMNHSAEIIARVKPDAIFASYPSVEALEIGVALSEKYGLPLISDFRDGLLFEPVEEGQLRHPATRHYYEALEAKVMALSRLVLTVSEPISAYFRERYAHPNVMTLHNGFDLDDIAPDMNIGLSKGVINIVHTGRLSASRVGTSGKGRGVDALSSALHILLERSPEMARQFRLHFVGLLSHAEQNSLAPFVAQDMVKLWGHLPRALALGFQRKADVLLLITAPDKASIATGKLFEYLAANKPILALTRGTEAACIISETGAGVVVSPDEPEEIAQAIVATILHGERLMDGRNEESIAMYARDRQVAVLASAIKSQMKVATS
jgi:glycosyltransferase involved in cell wall biosynthesis